MVSIGVLVRQRWSLPNLVKVGIVKDQEVFILLVESLDRVGGALGEVPDVTIVEILNLVSTEFIDSGNLDGATVDNTPFSLE